MLTGRICRSLVRVGRRLYSYNTTCITMKILLVFAVCLSVARADGVQQAAATESTSNKADAKSANAIPPVQQKPPLAYYTQLPQQRNPYLAAYLQKPYYVPQAAAAPTMLIIAQPALLPQQAIFSHAAQQLLQYFQANPQARYQFLQGTFQPQQLQQQAQQSYAQPQYYQAYQPPAQYYQQPQLYAAASPQQQPQYSFPQTAFQTLPASSGYAPSTGTIPSSVLSQVPGASSFGGAQSPLKTAAPIITGFENFTPEQQAQIKEQLSSHFGTSLTHLTGNSVQVPTAQFTTKSAESPNAQQTSAVESKDGAQSQAANYYRNQYAKQK